MPSLTPHLHLSSSCSVSLSGSPFLSCALSVISLLLFSCFPSDRSWQLPSGLFQALAHTHAFSPAPSSLFTLSLCLSPSLIISPSYCLTLSERTGLAVCVSKLELFLKALALTSTRSGGGPKQAGIHSSAYSSSIPVHLVGDSREGISHHVFVFLPWVSASLSTHCPFIYNEVSSLPVPVVAHSLLLARCFCHFQHVCMPTCPSLSFFPIYTSICPSVHCPARHSFC